MLEDKIMSELEEFGDLHEDTCQTLNEDECDCDMQGLKPFVSKVIAEVRVEDRKKIVGEIRIAFYSNRFKIDKENYQKIGVYTDLIVKLINSLSKNK